MPMKNYQNNFKLTYEWFWQGTWIWKNLYCITLEEALEKYEENLKQPDLYRNTKLYQTEWTEIKVKETQHA